MRGYYAGTRLCMVTLKTWISMILGRVQLYVHVHKVTRPSFSQILKGVVCKTNVYLGSPRNPLQHFWYLFLLCMKQVAAVMNTYSIMDGWINTHNGSSAAKRHSKFANNRLLNFILYWMITIISHRDATLANMQNLQRLLRWGQPDWSVSTDYTHAETRWHYSWKRQKKRTLIDSTLYYPQGVKQSVRPSVIIVVVVVGTKITKSRVLGICACYKHNKSVDIGEKLVCMRFEFLKKAY